MSLEAIEKRLADVDELWERRLNGFASIEHEGQLMDSVPALVKALRVAVEGLVEFTTPGNGLGVPYYANKRLAEVAALLEAP